MWIRKKDIVECIAFVLYLYCIGYCIRQSNCVDSKKKIVWAALHLHCICIVLGIVLDVLIVWIRRKRYSEWHYICIVFALYLHCIVLYYTIEMDG